MSSTPPIPHHHPSALRNRVPILKTLLSIVPDDTNTNGLEISTGTGALHELLAPAYPKITWHPSEYVPDIVVSEVRLDEERSDDLTTQSQAAKNARARTSVQDTPPS